LEIQLTMGSKDSIVSTQTELDKLTTQLKQMPELLKSNCGELNNNSSSSSDSSLDSDFSSDSDSDSDSNSDSSEYSSKSGSKSKSKSKTKSKSKSKPKSKSKESNLLKVYKKEHEIDNLEQKNYYKTLELNNLTLENSELKTENNELILNFKNNDNILNLISRFIDLNNVRFNENELYKYKNLKEITLKMMEIQNKYDNFIKESNSLKYEFSIIVDSKRNIKLRNCYITYIHNLTKKNELLFNKQTDIINKNINNMYNNKALYYIISIIILIISICVYFIK
jgi:hypothetical protein